MILGSLTLVLKIRFQFSSFATKKVQGFCSGRETIAIITLSSQNRVSILWIFFEMLILNRDFWGNVNHVHEIKLTSSRNLIESLSTMQKKKKKLRQFCRWTTAERDNVKINLSSNIPFVFLLFKICAFLQNFFPRKTSF